MTAVTAPATRTRTAPAAPAHHLSFLRVLRAEFLKLLTLRSTWWSLIITALLTVGMALLITSASSGGLQPVSAAVLPMQFTMLLAGILGAIAVSGEYSTGMIRSTLTAEPRRGAVLLTKALAVALTVFVATLITFAAAALVSAAVSGASIPWDDAAQSWLPLVSAAAAMAVFALIGVGFGFILRNGPAAIAATVGVLFVLPIVASIFSTVAAGWQWIGDLAQYLPMSAAQAFILPGGSLDQGVAGLTLVGWIVAALGTAWLVLRSRDA
ncbi:ABC transporter permease subunit [Microbacterium sp. W1N]|uniref:ABC transporter permease n=1 Tax=Microbacterium festucae TaxID=2977531 RepID=UPI0021BF4FA1|nr:ABC transporter permease subunit [Microbacterium festucae]MCT9820259.1 ABC transporter permease subunit [Microbacterium festucae]